MECALRWRKEVVAAIQSGDYELAFKAAIYKRAIGEEFNALMDLLAVAGWDYAADF